MKKVLLKTLLALGAITLVACGNSSTTPSSSSVVSSEEIVSSVEESVESSEVSSSSEEVVSSEESSVVTPFAIETEVEDGYTSEEVNGETVYTFTKEGTYTLTGTLTGQLLFSADLTVSVKLLLNDVHITSSERCIYWQADSKKVELVPLAGTNNTFESTGDKDTIRSENNIEINGYGAVTVVSHGKNALNGSNVSIGLADDEGNQSNPTVDLKAATEVIKAKQILMENGNVKIHDSDTAFLAEFNKKGAKGTLEVKDGTLEVSNCVTVAKVAGSCTVSGGTVIVTNCTYLVVADTEEHSPEINIASGTTTVDGTEFYC